VDTLRFDLRAAFTSLRREPRFTALVVGTLALGLGAATAIFTIVNRVVLHPVPYPDPSQIVYLGWSWKNGSRADALSARKFLFWHDHAHVFDGVTTYQPFVASLGDAASQSDVTGLRVSSDFFRVVRATPVLGRAFAPEETRVNGAPVAILSHALWVSRFGGDANVLQHPVSIDGRAYTIIGVMPPSFRLGGSIQPELFEPMAIGDVELADNGNNYIVMARLLPGISRPQARADVGALLEPFRSAYPNLAGPDDRGIRVTDFQEVFVGDLANRLWVLLAATGFVFMLTWANAANLALSRALTRRPEIAVRAALGATRGRLLHLHVLEGLMIGTVAAALSIGISAFGLRALLGLAPARLPVSDATRVDPWVIAFCGGLALLAGTVLGVVQATPMLRFDWSRGLSAGRTLGILGRRVGPRLLTALESAMAIVLLAGAGLMITTMTRLLGSDPGFARTGVFTARLSHVPAGYESASAVLAFDRRVLDRLRTTPGVRDAASVSTLPLEGTSNLPITIDGNPAMTEGSPEWRAVSPGFFRTMGIAVIQGRDISDIDGLGSPGAVIINRSLAERYWPGQNPIGHYIAVGQYQGKSMGSVLDEPPRQIIGVVADSRLLGLSHDAPHTVFVPQAQVPRGLVSVPGFVVRAAGGAQGESIIAEAVREVDPRMPVPTFASIHEIIAGSVAETRFSTMLLGVFAALALGITIIGVYSMAAYLVASRTRDIGVRLALGAAPHTVVAHVMRYGMLPVIAGLGAGLVAAFGLTRVLSGMIYGVSAHDPATIGVTTVLLLTVAFVGTWLPARRAARIDPVIALRSD